MIDIHDCIFCGMCQRKCPADSIVVDRDESRWTLLALQMRCVCGPASPHARQSDLAMLKERPPITTDNMTTRVYELTEEEKAEKARIAAAEKKAAALKAAGRKKGGGREEGRRRGRIWRCHGAVGRLPRKEQGDESRRDDREGQEPVLDKVLTAPNVIRLLRLLLAAVPLAALSPRHITSRRSSSTQSPPRPTGSMARSRVARIRSPKLGKLFFDPFVDRLLTAVGVIAIFILGRLPLWILAYLIVRDIIFADRRQVPAREGRKGATCRLRRQVRDGLHHVRLLPVFCLACPSCPAWALPGAPAWLPDSA